MNMKRCSKCSVEKSLAEFYKDKTKKDGLQYWCKQCALNNIKKWKSNNPEQFINTIKKWTNNTSGVYGIYGDDLCLYVGKSKGLNGRWKHHKYFIKHPKAVEKYQPNLLNLYNNIRLHSNVSIRIIEECSPELLLEREQHYIDTIKPLYNERKSGL